MKNFYLMLLIEYLSLIVPGTKHYNFFPNLPAGEYKINYVVALRDKQMVNHSIQLDYYFYKVSRNTTEIRGNTTLKTLFDDSYTVHMNLAVKDSIGGWKDNAFIYSAPGGCTMLQKFLEAEFPVLLNKLGFNDTKCPISAGHYVSKGYDLSKIFSNSKLPKVFFYGSYKATLYLTDKNQKISGHIIFIADIMRPWENV